MEVDQKTTSIYIDIETREELRRLAETDNRTLIDELRWIVKMENVRRSVDEVARQYLAIEKK